MNSFRGALAALLLTIGVLAVAADQPVAQAAANAKQPTRVLDTRTGTGGISGRLRPDATMRVEIPGSGGASAVALNVTATEATKAGYVRVWRCDQPQPTTSNVNYVPGHSVPNLAVVGVSNGEVCVSAHTPVHLVIDLTAVFTGSNEFSPSSPNRVLDTRKSRTRVRAGTVRRVEIAGTSGIPSGASAVAANFTVVNPSGNGYISTFPCASALTTGGPPNASTLNYRRGETVAGATFVALGAGDVCVFAKQDLDLVVDTFGTVPGSGSLDVGKPSRVLDTRNGTWSTGSAGSGQTLRLRVAGRGNVPNTAEAGLLTITVADARAWGYVTAWPCDQSMPVASTLNFWPGTVRANTAVLDLSNASGEVCLYVKSSDGSAVNLVADAVGSVAGSIQRPKPPAPPKPPTPSSGGKFTTLPPGTALPSGATCASRVRSAAEIRPQNNAANNNRGGRQYANARSDWSGFDRVDGDFAGTTDEIIQWAACKWGIDEDMVRAQVVKESWWEQSANGDNGESWGLGQVRDTAHQTAFEHSAVNARNSSAYNLDYTYANWRGCYEGVYTWLNNVEGRGDYRAGDAWGCMGVWFSGRWWTQDAINYIEGGNTSSGYGSTGVKEHLAARTWTTSEFRGG